MRPRLLVGGVLRPFGLRPSIGKAALLAALALAGCHRPHPAAAAPDGGGGFPELRVFPKQDHYLFSYYDAQGKIHDASQLGAIPEAARKQLLVRDLSQSPEALHSDRYLYLADLSGPAPDDGYLTTIVSRYGFEAQDDSKLPAIGGEAADDDGGGALVTVYGTSWCGACRAAREHLRARHVPFADRDIEKDPAAAADLARKAKRAGLRLGGVPVLDVGGQLLLGFDAQKVDELLAELRAKT